MRNFLKITMFVLLSSGCYMQHSPSISDASTDTDVVEIVLNPHCRSNDQTPTEDFPVYCPADWSWLESGQDLQCNSWALCDWIPDEPNDPGYDCWHCLNAGQSYMHWDGTWR